MIVTEKIKVMQRRQAHMGWINVKLALWVTEGLSLVRISTKDKFYSYVS